MRKKHYFMENSKDSYKFQKLICFFLRKNHHWKEIPYNTSKIVSWCYNRDCSLIKKYNFSFLFTRKDLLFLTLYKNKSKNIIPDTYLLHNGKWFPSIPSKKNTIWFCKHPYKEGSRGITVSKEVTSFISLSKENSQYNYVIQPSINDVWLYQDKYKCDIRLWGVICGDSQRLHLAIFNQGTIRQNPYCYREKSDLLNLQITNSSFFKKKLPLTKLIKPYSSHEPLYQASFIPIIQQIKDFWLTYKPVLIHKSKEACNKDIFLELFGFDFIVTKSLRPYLIEINRKPNYHNLPRYRHCVETMIPTYLEPLLNHQPFLNHPFWTDI